MVLDHGHQERDRARVQREPLRELDGRRLDVGVARQQVLREGTARSQDLEGGLTEPVEDQLMDLVARDQLREPPWASAARSPFSCRSTKCTSWGRLQEVEGGRRGLAAEPLVSASRRVFLTCVS